MADLQLLQLQRGGARFTWTKKQDNLSRCVLDWVFVSTEWEAKFPACPLIAETQLGLDHCPLILQSREEIRRPPRQFFFERQWLLQPGFVERMVSIWEAARANRPHRYGPLCDSLDEWKHCIRRSRHYLRGCGVNVGGQTQARMEELGAEIKP